MELIVRDNTILEPSSLARRLRAHLGPHPVPQSDPRTRGFVKEFRQGEAPPFAAELPELHGWIAELASDAEATYVFAVNETPPTPPNTFFMRPHIDRRWSGTAFGRVAARSTTVLFLEFPSEGDGGELVVFPADAFREGVAEGREGAREVVTRHQGVAVTPKPGRFCRFTGGLPHAVLSYSAPPASSWRLVVVLGEFPDLPR